MVRSRGETWYGLGSLIIMLGLWKHTTLFCTRKLVEILLSVDVFV